MLCYTLFDITPPTINTHNGPCHYAYYKFLGMLGYIVHHSSVYISVGLYNGVRIAVTLLNIVLKARLSLQ